MKDFLKKGKSLYSSLPMMGADAHPPTETTQLPLLSDELVTLSDLNTKNHDSQITTCKSELQTHVNAVSQQGRYDALFSGVSPLEAKMYALVNQCGGALFSDVLKHLRPAQRMLRYLKERKESVTDDEIKIQYLTAHDSEKQAKLDAARIPLIQIKDLERKRDKARDSRQKNAKSKQDILTRKYREILPEEIRGTTKVFFFAFMGIFNVGEGYLIFNAIENMPNHSMGFNGTLAMTVIITLALTVACHQWGKSLNHFSPVTQGGDTNTKNYEKI